MLVAHENHGARNALVCEDRRIVAGAARNFLVRQAEAARHGPEPRHPSRIHDSGGRFDPAVKLELNAALLADQAAFRKKQVVECLERLLTLAAHLEAEAQLSGN